MIRRITMTLAVLAVASLVLADEHMHAAAIASPSFDKMKALVGTWKADVPGMGTTRKGHAGRIQLCQSEVDTIALSSQLLALSSQLLALSS
jgi:hypothetical protein